LRRASLALVEEAEKNPLEARKTAIARLTPSQRDAFAALAKERGLTIKDATDPQGDSRLQFTDEKPFLSPLVHEGKVYFVSLGQILTPEFLCSDWSVTLEWLDNGQLKQKAIFDISETWGRLEKVSVKALATPNDVAK
jgi:hypothetical protein